MTNQYKHIPGDGVHIAESTIPSVGEFPQRAANGTVVAVPAGTVGQVPTYQADGTLAPADASGSPSASPLNYVLSAFVENINLHSAPVTFSGWDQLTVTDANGDGVGVVTDDYSDSDIAWDSTAKSFFINSSAYFSVTSLYSVICNSAPESPVIDCLTAQSATLQAALPLLNVTATNGAKDTFSEVVAGAGGQEIRYHLTGATPTVNQAYDVNITVTVIKIA